MRPLWFLLVSWPLLSSQPLPVVDDHACVGEVVLADIEGARLVGVCGDGDVDRELTVAVTNQQSETAGPLRAFRLGFCGSAVIRATGPEGWASTVDSSRSTVTWSRGGDAFGEPGLPTGASLHGFTVALKPGWRRSSVAAVTWEHATVAVRASLDCETTTTPPRGPREGQQPPR